MGLPALVRYMIVATLRLRYEGRVILHAAASAVNRVLLYLVCLTLLSVGVPASVGYTIILNSCALGRPGIRRIGFLRNSGCFSGYSCFCIGRSSNTS